MFIYLSEGKRSFPLLFLRGKNTPVLRSIKLPSARILYSSASPMQPRRKLGMQVLSEANLQKEFSVYRGPEHTCFLSSKRKLLITTRSSSILFMEFPNQRSSGMNSIICGIRHRG